MTRGGEKKESARQSYREIDRQGGNRRIRDKRGGGRGDGAKTGSGPTVRWSRGQRRLTRIAATPDQRNRASKGSLGRPVERK